MHGDGDAAGHADQVETTRDANDCATPAAISNTCETDAVREGDDNTDGRRVVHHNEMKRAWADTITTAAESTHRIARGEHGGARCAT
jgi:hypothetical protein